MSELSIALKQYYILRGITTRQLATQWGCSNATVSRFLNGKSVTQSQFITILKCLTEESQDD